MKIITGEAREVIALERRIKRQYGLGYIGSAEYLQLQQQMSQLKKSLDKAVPEEVKARFNVTVVAGEDEDDFSPVGAGVAETETA